MLRENTFCVEKAMQVAIRHKNPHDPVQPAEPNIDLDNIRITEEVLKHCTLKMARIVQQDDRYLQIFKRLKTELEELRKNNELKEYARKISTNEIEL